MYVVNSIVLRISIVLGMVAAVVTILYFTPMPDQNFYSCDRPCHDLDWPMICRVKLTLESQQPTTSVTQTSSCPADNCTLVLRERFLVNNESPGPSIQICQNDILVVDVVNKIPGHSITIHWRGQPQHEAPTMDGVPMITQCPISSYTTFQYKFRASTPGTHLWHAFSGSEIAGGIFGALVVRHPQKTEPHRKLFDIDDKNHVIVISEWGSLLINGKGPPETPLFHVKKGRRYRFRVAYAGGLQGCPVTITIENHVLKVIALDGNAIYPYEVSSVTLSIGERLDFILKTVHPVAKYVLKINSVCDALETRSFVKYDVVSDEMEVTTNASDLVDSPPVANRKFNTSFCESGLGRVCLGDVRVLENVPQTIFQNVDRRIYLGFDHSNSRSFEDRPNEEFKTKMYTVNNITSTYPSSPLLTQRDDVPTSNICNMQNRPQRCADKTICECVHVEEVSLGDLVELVLFDTGGDSEETVFHLHGYSFYVIGFSNLVKPLTLDEVKRLDEQKLLIKRNFVSPVLKDTVRVPKFGVVALRFLANNPGFWILRDEKSWQWSRGLDVVLRVGDSCDTVAKPSNFPMCGSWIGPDFFLT